MNLTTLVWMVVYAIGAGAIIGLLYFAITYCEQNFPAPMFWKIVRCAFVVLVVVIMCLVILAFMGEPQVRMR